VFVVVSLIASFSRHRSCAHCGKFNTRLPALSVLTGSGATAGAGVRLREGYHGQEEPRAAGQVHCQLPSAAPALAYLMGRNSRRPIQLVRVADMPNCTSTIESC